MVPGARHAEFVGGDRIEKDGRDIGFGGSVPLHVAPGSPTLLADRMNGEPLTRDHGAPLRVIVPGQIGARSVKWIGRIRLRDAPSENLYQARDYRLFSGEASATTARAEDAFPLGETSVNSAITEPDDGARVRPGSLTLRGYAAAGGGRSIERVEVTRDGGATWHRARLLDGPINRWT